jgi:hypothetical protein
MINRIKEVIFKKLYKDLSKTEIIPYQNGIWFIDREKKYWYLEYKKNGDLWWRYNFFENFFLVFSLERSEYEPLICEWVEEVLNCRVTTPSSQCFTDLYRVEGVLNCRVTTPNFKRVTIAPEVEEVLNYKVTTLKCNGCGAEIRVEDVLNCKVITPARAFNDYENVVEEVLNYKVITPRDSNPSDLVIVEEVLNGRCS